MNIHAFIEFLNSFTTFLLLSIIAFVLIFRMNGKKRKEDK